MGMREGDESDDGLLSREEFADLLADPRIHQWLAAQEIDVKDADLVFTILDDEGDDHLSTAEIVRGFAKLKGPARSMDIASVSHSIMRLEQHVHVIGEKLGVELNSAKLTK